MGRTLVRVLIVGTGSLLLLLVLLPALLPGSSMWVPLDRGLLRPFCHQLPERCLRLGDVSMAVCARCFGLYLGATLAALAAVDRLAWTRARARRVALLTLLPMALDVLLQGRGLYSSLTSRLVTGFVAAFFPLLAALATMPGAPAPAGEPGGALERAEAPAC